RKLSRKTELFVFAFKKNPVPKGAGFFAVCGMLPPVALRLPGLRIRHGATPLWRGQAMQH
ncbi:hypothetical protein ACW9S7_004728, partial [Klebsiella quasipneumoniae]